MCLSNLETKKPELRHYLTWVGLQAPYPSQHIGPRLAHHQELPQLSSPPRLSTHTKALVALLIGLPAILPLPRQSSPCQRFPNSSPRLYTGVCLQDPALTLR